MLDLNTESNIQPAPNNKEGVSIEDALEIMALQAQALEELITAAE